MQRHNTRLTLSFLLVIVFIPTVLLAQVIAPPIAKIDEEQSTVWHDIRSLDIEGRAWKDTKSFYDRLPARAEGVVRDPVWELSHDSSGIAVRFQTDATTIKARWTLRRKRSALPHMPATGASGLDLYVRVEDGSWRWLGIGRPEKFPVNEATLVSGIPEGEREYFLYLPLYNGVTSVEIGIPTENVLEAGTPRSESHAKPLVFWGTSITQGACASRPGMVHTAILGRRLDRPVINLGFSGNGRMEPEMAQLLAELDPVVYIIDCLPNLEASEVKQRTEPLVHLLRQSHPDTPILLVEDRTYANAFLIPSKMQRNLSNRRELKAAYERLKASGVTHLYYLVGDNLLGQDGEDTVDSSHPTDLGFMRQAETMQNALLPILNQAHDTHQRH